MDKPIGRWMVFVVAGFFGLADGGTAPGVGCGAWAAQRSPTAQTQRDFDPRRSHEARIAQARRKRKDRLDQLRAPCPPSPVFQQIRWDPPEAIVRKAPGSDNWPLTWADDDWMYTAYGDGRGFEPFVDVKLGLGLAKIQGRPPDFLGVNLRSLDIENRHQGAAGKKASGMLMVDGRLYMLLRNAGNAELAWSDDRARTWQHAPWRFEESFGCPTFLNFGKDYQGARDGLVYIYSHDSPSAYQPADRTVLARVPKQRLTDRTAYEFFAGTDAHGQPKWSRQIADRGAVLSYRGLCYRTSASYYAPFRRYLLCQILFSEDPRFAGGLGIYDAPEPWGPWTTVYFTPLWDVGPGETASIPTKWISPDGKSFWLVFSGDDCFSVRRAEVVAGTPEPSARQAAKPESPHNAIDNRKEVTEPSAGQAARPESARPFQWQTGPPESQGFASAKLEKTRADLAARNTKALLVIRNDTIVCEWYAPDHGPDRRHGTASLAKAIVGGLSLAVAVNDGRIGLDDRAAQFIPAWRSDPLKSRITLRHLGSHTSGLEDAEEGGQPHEQLTGWKGDFWKQLPVPNDPFSIARDRTPLQFEPGQRFQYSNPGIAMLGYCVTAALRGAPQPDIRSLLRERIMRPIGVADSEWSVGYGKTFLVEGLPLVACWGGGSYTARAAARVGRLMLRQGDWDGKRLLRPEAVRLTTADAGTPGPCGMGWWCNQDGDFPELPPDAFFGSGAGHQILLVVPSRNLLVIRNGAALAKVPPTPKAYHEPYRHFLFKPLMDAMNGP